MMLKYEYMKIIYENHICELGTQKKCPFLLNRVAPSREVADTKIVLTFFRDQISCPLN